MVIVVGMALSDCLSGQLHGHCFIGFTICFILLFLQCNLHCQIWHWHCLIGKLSISDSCIHFIGVCLYLTIGSVLVLNLIVRWDHITLIKSNHYFLINQIFFVFLLRNHNFLCVSMVTTSICCPWQQMIVSMATCFYGYLLFAHSNKFLFILFIQMVTSVSLVTGNFSITFGL